MHARATDAAQDTVASVMQAFDEDHIRRAPDEFSWRILAAISHRVTEFPAGQAPADWASVPSDANYAEWETWANDVTLFPSHPVADHPPLWADRTATAKDLIIDPLLAAATALRMHPVHPMKRDPFIPGGGQDQDMEIRHNAVDVQLIVNSKLWSRDGLAEVIKSGTNSEGIPNALAKIADTDPLYRQAIEIKAEWQPITANQKGQYHWNIITTADGKAELWGVRALHIMTRGLHSWTWSTFENVNSNASPCDYYSCTDHYGCSDSDPKLCPSVVHPESGEFPRPYKQLSLPLRPEVRALFNDAEWNDWQNYRLIGTQIFYDNPRLLGNSILEASVSSGTSSCISCHAAVRGHIQNGKAYIRCDRGFVKNSAMYPDNISLNGPPSTLYSANFKDAEGNLPLGFIWSIRNIHDSDGSDVCLPTPDRSR